ncbi:MAG: ABC transporter permease [Clostridiales bacterium]|nr:ABC transporter permease [Clostridiales bacterium]
MKKKISFRFHRRAFAYPYMIFLLLFVVVPLVIILVNAFLTDDGQHLTFAHFVEFFSNAGGGLTVLGNSLIIGAVTTLICLVIGYPCAYLLAKYHAGSKVLVLLFILPMWVNFLIRTLSTKAIFMALDVKLGMGTVLFGMVYNYLPYMILPLHTTLVSIDHSYIEAAEDLGADKLTVFLKTVLPLSLSGIISGITMTFIPAISTFAISEILSSSKIFLFGDAINMHFSKTTNSFGVGSVMSLVMLVLVIVANVIVNITNKDEEVKSSL